MRGNPTLILRSIFGDGCDSLNRRITPQGSIGEASRQFAPRGRVLAKSDCLPASRRSQR